MTRTFIGLGSNQGDSRRLLEQALRALKGLARTSVNRCSAYYRTAPLGDPDQPEFLNAVAELDTTLAPLELLCGMQRIEDRLGRTRDRERRWGPRTIDLDLLLFGNMVIRHPDLVVPHPRMGNRAFVLVPLAELVPQLEIPGLGRVSELLADIDTAGVRRVNSESPDTGVNR